MKRLLTLILLLAGPVIVLARAAFGYLDPGAGSFACQVLLAGIVGTLFLSENLLEEDQGLFLSPLGQGYSAVITSETGFAVGGSFRDPSGFVYIRKDQIYRQVNRSYQENYDHLMRSGLYDALLRDELLIPHQEVQVSAGMTDEAYKVIQPERISFTSYPYEWCFSQLKDAALLTLRIQSLALEFGMSLKDASAYNVQFRHGRPILIDTLSFEKYAQGKPWVAYRQFCQQFLAPLALMSRKDVRLRRLISVFLDGVPLDLASKLLPLSTWANFGLLSHIHLQAKAQRRWAHNSKLHAAGWRSAAMLLLGWSIA